MEEERKRVLAEQKRLESAYVVSREAQAAPEPLRRQALEGAPEFFEAEIWIIAKTSPAEDFTEYARSRLFSQMKAPRTPVPGSLVANVPSEDEADAAGTGTAALAAHGRECHYRRPYQHCPGQTAVCQPV